MSDGAKMVLNEQISQALPLQQSNQSQLDGFTEEQKKQIARDFESLLINELLEEMKNTIGGWGFEKDGTSEQVYGLFWLYLARDVANNGGIGLWKDIYQTLTGNEQTNSTGQSLDGNL